MNRLETQMDTKPEEEKQAWYSAKAAERYGTHIYASVDGREVEVTEVSSNADSYKWDDKVDMGKVTKRLRDGEKPSHKFLVDKSQGDNYFPPVFPRYNYLEKILGPGPFNFDVIQENKLNAPKKL